MLHKRLLIPVFVILAVLFGACGVNIDVDIDKGSGNIITESRSVSGFDQVILSGIGDVTLIQGDREGIDIEAEDNVVPNIITEVNDGTLLIRFDRKSIIPTEPIRFKLYMKEVRGIETQGVSNVEAKTLKTNQIELGISGTGNITIRDLQADQMNVNISGAGNLDVEGRVKQQIVTMSGAGNYDGEDMQSQTANITITGLGKVTAWVTDALDVTISGTGSIDYFGSPQIKQQITGLGRLKHLGDK